MIDRKSNPAAISEIRFHLPKPNEILLDNGLRITFISKDKLPLVRLNLILNAGSKYDPENKKGLSYLTSLVMDEGADGMNALQLSDEFDIRSFTTTCAGSREFEEWLCKLRVFHRLEFVNHFILHGNVLIHVIPTFDFSLLCFKWF